MLDSLPFVFGKKTFMTLWFHFHISFFIFSPGKGDNNTSSDLSEIYRRLESIEADKAPAKAAVILAGLGFTPQMQKQHTKYVLQLRSIVKLEKVNWTT